MDALIASYGDNSSDSDSEVYSIPPPTTTTTTSLVDSSKPLPPPPLSLLEPPNFTGSLDILRAQSNRIRSFPHVEGNFALHVYIPVYIPDGGARKELAQFVKRIATVVPLLNVIDFDILLSNLLKDESKFEQLVLGREFHVSLGRTVPIRVHQRDSILSMLRQKLHVQKRYPIDFSNWEVFVNDDHTRTFVSLEVITRGLVEITKQIQVVNEVYRLHNLPEFYKDPRPHISVAWALGDISGLLNKAVEEEIKRHVSTSNSLKKPLFTTKFGGILCKIGNKTHEICKLQD
ncbi:hypothetical protein LIER_14799 [Lithospermum erythrorhizon]|uniref:U6 snRNA phosphodiesterase n=1 Tax=Lithospermum erythrorhizon TaxID=34254 RepID=A0AAV3Q1Z4_LITER